jgi:hypothetical protein
MVVVYLAYDFIPRNTVAVHSLHKVSAHLEPLVGRSSGGQHPIIWSTKAWACKDTVRENCDLLDMRRKTCPRILTAVKRVKKISSFSRRPHGTCAGENIAHQSHKSSHPLSLTFSTPAFSAGHLASILCSCRYSLGVPFNEENP